MRNIYLFLYYLIARRWPMQPFPGYLTGYKLRRHLANKLLRHCGDLIIVKDRCYFGDGTRLSVGDRSQLGQNSRLNGLITIGNDVLMGPDIVMMATSHAFQNPDHLINLQGAAEEREIVIGDNVWIGTRAIILPGVTVGSHSIVAAGAVVTKDVPEYSIVGGNPARVIRSRKQLKQ
ncbi:acyltransferase [Verrucomicrobiaceae bacterium 227]